jgi:hypothetical protein
MLSSKLGSPKHIFNMRTCIYNTLRVCMYTCLEYAAMNEVFGGRQVRNVWPSHLSSWATSSQ